MLSPLHQHVCLAWCRQCLRFRRQDWAAILFTDESRFHLHWSDGRRCIYRREGEHYADACVVQHSLFSGGSVIVWGSPHSTEHHRTQMEVINGNLTGIRYHDQVLRPPVPAGSWMSHHTSIGQHAFSRRTSSHRLRRTRTFPHFLGHRFRLIFLQKNMCVMKRNDDFTIFKTSRRRWPNCNKPWYRYGTTSLKG